MIFLRNKPLNAVATVLYLICAVATVCLIIPMFDQEIYRHSEKLVTGLIVFAFGFIASKLMCIENREKAPKIMKRTVIWLTAVYLFVLIDYTLISGSFGRNISNIFWADKVTIQNYFTNKINIIPFATVKLFLKSDLQRYVIIENILGNLFVLMPFALMMPYLFKKLNNTCRFFIFAVALSFGIELLQIVFLTGVADIDDFILNVSGAMVAYAVLKITFVNRLINKLIFGEANEN